MTISKATYAYYVDWNNDGDFSDANEEVTSDVLSAQWEYGVDWSSTPGRSKIGACRIKLDNSDGRFSSYNTASPLNTPSQLILPGRAVKVTMTISPAAAVTMWYGYLESLMPTPGIVVGVSTAELLAYGPLSQISDTEVHLALQTNHATGALVTHILDAASYSASLRSLDTGLSTLSKFFVLRDSSALGVLRELEDAESGLIRETKDGKIAFEARDHRINAPHDAPIATFGSGGLYTWNITQEDPLNGIYNAIEASVRTFNASETVQLACITDIRNGLGGAAIPITGSGGTRTVRIEFPTASTSSAYIAVKTWGIVTYEANTAANISGTDITTNVSAVKTEYADRMEIVFTNANASAGFIVVLKVDGTAIVEGDPIPVKSSDATSQGKYRIRNYPSPSRWMTDIDIAEAYCAHTLAIYKDPVPRLSFTLMANYSAAHLAQAQALDVSDRIHIDATAALYSLGISQDCFIEYIRHKVDSQSVHTVDYQCRAVKTDVWAATGTAYTDKTVPDGVPDDLYVNYIDPVMHITFGCRAWKYNQNIAGARFRAKFSATALGSDESMDLRTVAEGGTMAHNPAGGMYVVDTAFFANQYGAQYEFDSASEGFWYFAFQFTSKAGDSVWSDGNKTPRYVKDCAETDAAGASTGPPSDWWVEVIPDPSGRHAVIVRASRPKTNGQKIWRWVAQIKDGSTGSWRRISENVAAYWSANVFYGDIGDSGYGDIPHVSSNNNTRLTRGANPYGGLKGRHAGDIAHIGDLILFDPRGGVWAEEYCGWGTIDTIQGLKAGYDVYTADYFDVTGRFHNTVTTDLRVLVVNPPWNWNVEGYFGDELNHGIYERWYWDDGEHGDTTTQIFQSDPIDVPADVALGSIEARVWFDNGFSTWDNDLTTGGVSGDSGNPTGASGLEIITNSDDSSVPVGSVAFRWNRETSNYRGIYVIAAWVSSEMPAAGPYHDERDAHPSTIIEEGTCTIVAGNKAPTVIRSADASVLGKVMVIYIDDASPDSDLDGNVVVEQGANVIVLSDAFRKGGTFKYAIVDCWWPNEGSTNVAFFQWSINQVTYDIEKTVWQTPPVPWPSGTYYVTLANRNLFGLGTRLVAGGTSTPDPPHQYVSNGCVPLDIYMLEVETDTGLGRTFSINATSDFTLNDPTGTHHCGMTVLWMISGSGVPTLGSKFRLMDGETISKSSYRDLLGAIYNATDDEWDAIWKRGTGPRASMSASPSGPASISASPSAPSATPSSTPSPSPSGTKSASPSVTQSPSASESASPSATPSSPFGAESESSSPSSSASAS